MSNYSDSSFARDKNSSWFKVFSMIKPGSKVLDVGCSSGNFGQVLIKEKKCVVHGIEIDQKDFEAAGKQLHKVFKLNIETDKLRDLDSDYDYIYFGDVIEHLVEPDKALARVLPLLKPGGRLLFSVPNMTHLLVRLMLLQGRFEYGKTGLLDKTHLHYYDYEFLQSTLNKAGFEIDKMDPVKKDLPEEVIAGELEKTGLKSTAAFIKRTRTTHAAIYQFVGSAKKAPAGRKPVKEKLAVSSPVDVFQSYLDQTVKYYENTVAGLNKHIEQMTKQHQELAAKCLSVETQNQEMQASLAEYNRLRASKAWKLVRLARKAKSIGKGR